MSDPTEVVIGECPCPGTSHPEGDVVFLKDEPDVPMFVAFNITWSDVSQESLSINEWQADIQGRLAALYLRHGIRRWTFTDEKDNSVPITPGNVARLLPYMKGGKEVADACAELYSEKLTAPFVEEMEKAKKARALQRRTKKSSPRGPTDASTSPTSDSGSKLRVVSKPSSPDVTDGRPSEVRAS